MKKHLIILKIKLKMTNKFLVIIPARKNSRRLISKNSKILCGKPLISYTIEYAIKNFHLDDIWVNTDDNKIISIAKKYGVRTYLRKSELATNTTLIGDTIYDQCKFFEKKKLSYQDIILLQPTNPFRENFNINEVMKIYLSKKIKSLMTVSRINKKLGKISNNKFLPFNYKFEQRSQKIESLYFENGALYIFNKDLVLNHKKLISDQVYPFITSGVESEIDIDYEEDFKAAELYIKTNLI